MMFLFLLAVTPPLVQFDYFGTFSGGAQIRGKCSTSSEKEKEIVCQFTEVRPIALERVQDEYQEVNLALSDYNAAKIEEQRKKKLPFSRALFNRPTHMELRKFWKSWRAAILTKEPDTFESQKIQECKVDPRDFFTLRAAYNEAYDEFLDHAKSIQRLLCNAKDPDAFIHAKIQRWDLVTNTCELNYAHYVQVLKNDGDRTWTSVGAVKGPFPLTECYTTMKTRIDCTPKSGCRLGREYSGLKSETKPFAIGRGGNDRSTCLDYPKKLDEVFEAGLVGKRPSHCKFFFDRERASHCCAYK